MLCFINPWLAWMLREKRFATFHDMFMNSEEAKNMIFHNRKKTYFGAPFYLIFSTNCFYLLQFEPKNHSKNESRALWKTFFSSIAIFHAMAKKCQIVALTLSWSVDHHPGMAERENQIDFGNKIFVFLSSWKIDAGCIWWNAMSLLVCAEPWPPLSNRTKRG